MHGNALIVRWAPRVLALCFVAFLSIFALDVFGAYSGLELFTAFFIHLIPALALFLIVAIAWHYQLVGAAAFIAFAIWYVWSAGFDKPYSWYLVIVVPAVLTGVLYLVDWYRNRSLQ